MKHKPTVKKKENRFDLLNNCIDNFSKDIVIPNNLNESNININTDLNNIKFQSNSKIIKKKFILKNELLKNDPVKTKKYLLLPTYDQKKIFQLWFDAYIEMYNFVICKIKTEFRNKLQDNMNFKLVDLDINLNMTNLKKEAVYEKILLRKKYTINMHILDYAISDAIAMFKSKICNLKKGHIKKSRLRYLKKSKNNKIFKIEKFLCSPQSFCVSLLGKEIKTKPLINFKNKVKTVAIVQYDFKKDKYLLLIREEIINNNNDKIDIEIKSIEKIINTTNNYFKEIK